MSANQKSTIGTQNMIVLLCFDVLFVDIEYMITIRTQSS